MSAAAPARAATRASGWTASAVLLGASALLGAATLAWPALTVLPREARSRAAAAAALERAAAAERGWAREHGAYAAIEADGTLRGGSPEGSRPAAGDFQIDALPQPDGRLRLRAVSRPEAIGAGLVFPVLLDALLPPPPPAAGNAR